MQVDSSPYQPYDKIFSNFMRLKLATRQLNRFLARVVVPWSIGTFIYGVPENLHGHVNSAIRLFEHFGSRGFLSF